MPDSWDSPDGHTHYVGDDCAPAHAALDWTSSPLPWADLETLATYPRDEWVFFADDDGVPLPFEDADPVCIARLMGLVESAVGPKGVMGPTYHRLTDAGRAALADRAREVA